MGIENLPLIDMTHEEAKRETILEFKDLLDGLDPWQQEIAESELRNIFSDETGALDHEV